MESETNQVFGDETYSYLTQPYPLEVRLSKFRLKITAMGKIVL